MNTQLEPPHAHVRAPQQGRLRVLIVHNRYQQPGGEDAVFEAEASLLESFGHSVELYGRHNDELKHYSALRGARDAFWNTETVKVLRPFCNRFRPHVVHVHNTFPLISPSVYWAAQSAGAAVVQTLHNYRLLCPQSFFVRSGRSCEDCLGHLPWRAIVHGCYRGSRHQSAVLVGMIAFHRALRTHKARVSRFIALTDFARDKFIAGGFPPSKIAVKPNFIEDVGQATSQTRAGGLFVGRLSSQKGVELLVDALAMCNPRPAFRLAGGGELEGLVHTTFGNDWKGLLPRNDVLNEMRRAAFLVLPSLGFEGFPRTIVEAYSCGLPVLASRSGPLKQIVLDGETGLLFEPGDAADLARALQWANAHPGELARMGMRARAEYESRYSPVQNYRQLHAIYAEAVTSASGDFETSSAFSARAIE